jgi:nicotinate-nucleotide adenylyltransferase
VYYSVDTVARMKKKLRKRDRLFFIIGIDAFRDLGTWREPRRLLRSCEFIVVSRPGFRLRGAPLLRGDNIHLLPGVHEPVSATAIRRAAQRGRGLARLVPPPVAAYIRKHRLYGEVE